MLPRDTKFNFPREYNTTPNGLTLKWKSLWWNLKFIIVIIFMQDFLRWNEIGSRAYLNLQEQTNFKGAFSPPKHVIQKTFVTAL